MNFSINDYYKQKALNFDNVLTAPNLADQITKTAFNNSNLLMNMSSVSVEQPQYSKTFVASYPDVITLMEGQVIPTTQVASYSTTVSDFTKIGSSVELTNEALKYSKFDLQAHSMELGSIVQADNIANYVLTDMKTREAAVPDSTGEQILQLKSGATNSWGSDTGDIWANISNLIKTIPDMYDSNSKLYMNKNNALYFMSLTTASYEAVALFQNGLLMGKWAFVIVEQLPDETIYFGDMSSAFDVVYVHDGWQTVDSQTKPDCVNITNTASYANVAKDTKAITVLIQSV